MVRDTSTAGTEELRMFRQGNAATPPAATETLAISRCRRSKTSRLLPDSRFPRWQKTSYHRLHRSTGINDVSGIRPRGARLSVSLAPSPLLIWCDRTLKYVNPTDDQTTRALPRVAFQSWSLLQTRRYGFRYSLPRELSISRAGSEGQSRIR